MSLNTSFLTRLGSADVTAALPERAAKTAAEEATWLQLRPADFPKFDEELLLPKMGACEEQELRSLLPEDAESVPGPSFFGWRRSVVLGDPAGALWLTNGELVLGMVWCHNALYQVKLIHLDTSPQGPVWTARLERIEPTVLVDQVPVPEAEEEVEASSEPTTMDDYVGSTGVVDRSAGPFHINVLAAYTEGAIQSIRQNSWWEVPKLDPLRYHQLMLQETINWTFWNCGLPIGVEVQFLELPGYNREPLNAPETWCKLSAGREQPFSHLHRYRNRANVLAIIGKFGGMGWAGDGACAPTDGALVIDWQDACQFFGFAHELGHLLGADHQGTPNSWTQEFARAYCFGDYGAWKTVMATSGVGCSGVRLPLWSKAETQFRSIRHGDRDRDNARAILERAPIVSQFG